MRHLIPIIVLSLVLSCGQKDTQQEKSEIIKEEPAQNQQPNIEELDTVRDTTTLPAGKTETPAQKILNIRNEYARINSLKLSQKKVNFVCDTDGTMTYFTSNGRVLKTAIDWGAVGHGSSTSEFYYKNDKLIFAYETYTVGPINGPDVKTVYRTYVHHDKTIRYMENDQVLPCKTCQFNGSSKAYRALASFQTEDVKSALCK